MIPYSIPSMARCDVNGRCSFLWFGAHFNFLDLVNWNVFVRLPVQSCRDGLLVIPKAMIQISRLSPILCARFPVVFKVNLSNCETKKRLHLFYEYTVPRNNITRHKSTYYWRKCCLLPISAIKYTVLAKRVCLHTLEVLHENRAYLKM